MSELDSLVFGMVTGGKNVSAGIAYDYILSFMPSSEGKLYLLQLSRQQDAVEFDKVMLKQVKLALVLTMKRLNAFLLVLRCPPLVVSEGKAYLECCFDYVLARDCFLKLSASELASIKKKNKEIINSVMPKPKKVMPARLL